MTQMTSKGSKRSTRNTRSRKAKEAPQPDPEFEAYWAAHQKYLIKNAPRELQESLLKANTLDTPMDWVCFALPVGVGIAVQSMLRMQSVILSWLVVVVVVVVLFVLLQMAKPHITKKKTPAQVIEEIKQYYVGRYREKGDLTQMESWNL